MWRRLLAVSLSFLLLLTFLGLSLFIGKWSCLRWYKRCALTLLTSCFLLSSHFHCSFFLFFFSYFPCLSLIQNHNGSFRYVRCFFSLCGTDFIFVYNSGLTRSITVASQPQTRAAKAAASSKGPITRAKPPSLLKTKAPSTKRKNTEQRSSSPVHLSAADERALAILKKRKSDAARKAEQARQLGSFFFALIFFSFLVDESIYSDT